MKVSTTAVYTYALLKGKARSGVRIFPSDFVNPGEGCVQSINES